MTNPDIPDVTTSPYSEAEALKAVVRRNTELVQGQGDFALFDELFADDFVDPHPPARHHTGQSRCSCSLQPAAQSVSRLSRRHLSVQDWGGGKNRASGDQLIAVYRMTLTNAPDNVRLWRNAVSAAFANDIRF